MIYSSLEKLGERTYRWGLFTDGKWAEKGSLAITHKGVLLDDEKLENPRYHELSHALVFGGAHGTFARTGRFVFDTTQLFFHGTMELDDGASGHVIGFANFDATYTTIIKPKSNPDAAGKPGPTLAISIDTTAFDGSSDTSVVKYTLTEDGTPTDVTNRVTSRCLKIEAHTFEIEMGPGPPFPPTTNRFCVIMQTDMTAFDGTFEFNPSPDGQFLWSGRKEPVNLTERDDAIEDAKSRLANSKVRKIRNVAAAKILATLTPEENCARADADAEGPAVLPGLDALDLAFIAKMDAKGIKIATIDNIRAITTTTDKHGKPAVVDKAQKITASAMNTATLQSLKDPWKTDFQLKPEPLDSDAQAIRQKNLEFFQNNATLQMGSLLKYKQDSFSGADLAALKTVNQKKLDKTWKLNSMKPQRLAGYQKASTDMYAYAYKQIAAEFAAYSDNDSEQWGRAYFHWLTDPSQMTVWQKQFAIMDGRQVTTWIYEWHAKLSILAPTKPYAAKMQAYALASYIFATAEQARWSADGVSMLTEAIASAGQANSQTFNAAGQSVDDSNAPFIKQSLEALTTSVGADIAASAISAAALDWQKDNPEGPYYGFLYSNASALDAISQKMTASARAAFDQWITTTNDGDAGSIPPEQILAYCVFAANVAHLLAGLAPKSPATPDTGFEQASGADLPPDVAWVLKGIKIGQVVINSSAGIFGFLFARRIASLWTQYIGEADQAAPEFSEALAALTGAVEDVEEISGWALAFGSGISVVAKIVGPILAMVGTVIATINLAFDIENGRVADGIADALSVLVGLIGVTVGLAVLTGLMTAATAGPIGLVIAIVGLIVLAFKLLWDWLFPTPSPIQTFVEYPLTELGVVDSPAGRTR